ncbi:MAG: hypothetical protein ACI9DF_004772 [Verrucomicrobiales bacterium]
MNGLSQILGSVTITPHLRGLSRSLDSERGRVPLRHSDCCFHERVTSGSPLPYEDGCRNMAVLKNTGGNLIQLVQESQES